VNLRLILLGRHAAGASLPTNNIVCFLKDFYAYEGLNESRLQWGRPGGAAAPQPPLTSFAESAVQSARHPPRRLGAKHVYPAEIAAQSKSAARKADGASYRES
jgi:hypothetical protein